MLQPQRFKTTRPVSTRSVNCAECKDTGLSRDGLPCQRCEQGERFTRKLNYGSWLACDPQRRRAAADAGMIPPTAVDVGEPEMVAMLHELRHRRLSDDPERGKLAKVPELPTFGVVGGKASSTRSSKGKAASAGATAG